jgi:hypothetical protein
MASFTLTRGDLRVVVTDDVAELIRISDDEVLARFWPASDSMIEAILSTFLEPA